jgi:hypothetical protein
LLVQSQGGQRKQAALLNASVARPKAVGELYFDHRLGQWAVVEAEKEE